MGNTPRFNLRYPLLTDAPNGPQALQFLAEDTEAWLTSAFPCTSTTRPTGVPDWFLIGETDTGRLLRYSSDASSWVEIASGGGGTTGGGGGGGGGGGTVGSAAEGQFMAEDDQDLSHNTNTVLAFGTTEIASDVVTRATSGSGHKFTLLESGTYAVTATIRFSSGDEGTRFIELENSARNTRYVATGGFGGPRAETLHFSLTKGFPAGQELVVIGNQRSGGTLSTQAQGDSITDGFVRLTIVKLTG